MAVTGIHRYFRLWKHIANPGEYAFRKGERRRRNLLFTTRPRPIQFQVPDSLYQVFKEIFMQDVYEIDDLVKTLPDAPVIIDVGANAGFFDIILLSKIKKAVIYAYEPMPANVKALQQTMAQNPTIQSSVKLFQMAVTGLPLDKLDLFAEAEENNQVVASRFADFNENNTRKITVSCITLSAIIEQNQLERIDLLKLDCEGSEYDIIYHTDPVLIQRIRRMVVEVHNIDQERNNIQAFDSYLKSLGYSTTYEPLNEYCFALEAVRQ